jgi:hypothetical protein
MTSNTNLWFNKTWNHYSHVPITTFKDVSPHDKADRFIIPVKPVALYFSPDTNWLNWCAEAQFDEGDESKYHKYTISNIADLKIFDISNFNNITDYFTIDFCNPNIKSAKMFGNINFEKIYNEGYDGIYVSETAATYKGGYVSNDNFNLRSYDVETLAIWNTSKLKFV